MPASPSKLRAIAFLTGLLLTAGFSSNAVADDGPTEQDLQTAYVNSVNAKGGVDGIIDINAIAKTIQLDGCAPANGEAGYWCDFSMTVFGIQEAHQGRLIKTKNGWKLMQMVDAGGGPH